ncbi:hypothetical protein [Nostoc sp. MS1]|uniref:hypothetical protein n=1 Tax=Nostoc sp. MS1 TaxID=2764711 RepID=UPI001CC3D67C|nr:hypothetical protein [Nostoc sp. MS1]BCL39854.1 hypothetical protein NSMS1_63010 [Nostoc sp. MS1]
MQVIKYQYAINSDGETVNAATLIANAQVRRQIYKCISCSNILIPVLGEKNRKHFRHKPDIEVQCSPETYLHKLAKNTFYDIYNNCLRENSPFLIKILTIIRCKFNQQFLNVCKPINNIQSFDLTQYFKNVKLESKDDSFIPDLLLTNEKGDKIYVEIAVNHKSSLNKIYSKSRIIEIDIKSEEDIEIIKTKLLIESRKVKFFNFRREQIKNLCTGQCFQASVKNSKNTETDIDDLKQSKNKDLLKELAASLPKDNCFLCRHHRKNVRKDVVDTVVYCTIRKKTCKPHVAKNCIYYQPNSKSADDIEKKL